MWFLNALLDWAHTGTWFSYTEKKMILKLCFTIWISLKSATPHDDRRDIGFVCHTWSDEGQTSSAIGIGDLSGRCRVHRDNQWDCTCQIPPCRGQVLCEKNKMHRHWPRSERSYESYISNSAQQLCPLMLLICLMEGVIVADWPASLSETFHARIHLTHESLFRYFKYSKWTLEHPAFLRQSCIYRSQDDGMMGYSLRTSHVTAGHAAPNISLIHHFSYGKKTTERACVGKKNANLSCSHHRVSE